jgi:hypothetical protein
MMIIGQTSRAVKLLATAGYCADDLLTAYHRSTLNFAELDTMFSSVTNIVNQRPIAVKSFTEEDGHAITPNDLLRQRIMPGGQRIADICPVEEQVISDNRVQEEVIRSETDVAEEETEDTNI